MKKILSVLILGSLLALPVMILAQNEIETLPEVPLISGIEKIGNLVFTVLLAIAAVMIVIGGILFVTAAGSVEQTTRARNLLLFAVVGIVIAFLAKGLVSFITTYLIK